MFHTSIQWSHIFECKSPTKNHGLYGVFCFILGVVGILGQSRLRPSSSIAPRCSACGWP